MQNSKISADSYKYHYVADSTNQEIKFLDTSKSPNELIDFITLADETFPSMMGTSLDGSKLYLTRHDAKTLLIINTATSTVINTIPLPNFSPYGIILSADDNRLFINSDTQNLSTLSI